MNQDLKIYIDSARVEGHTDKSIREELVKSGWDASIVDSALHEDQNFSVSEETSELQEDSDIASEKEIKWSNKKKGIYWLTRPWMFFIPVALLWVLFSRLHYLASDNEFYFISVRMVNIIILFFGFISATFSVVGIPLGIFYLIKKKQDIVVKEHAPGRADVRATTLKYKKRTLKILISPIFVWIPIIVIHLYIAARQHEMIIRASRQYSMGSPGALTSLFILYVQVYSLSIGFISIILSIGLGIFFTKTVKNLLDTRDNERPEKKKDSVVPNEVKGWSWGAAGLGWVWGIYHSVWISLLVFIPFWWIVMGLKGNEWAWRKNHYKNVEDFKDAQSKWSRWGILMLIISFIFISFIASSPYRDARKVMRDKQRVEDIEIINAAIRKTQKIGFIRNSKIIIGNGPGESNTLCGDEVETYWAKNPTACGSDPVIAKDLPGDPLPSKSSYEYYSHGTTYRLIYTLEKGFSDGDEWFGEGTHCDDGRIFSKIPGIGGPGLGPDPVWMCLQGIKR